ncbi:MAG: hypothetical protein C4290_09915 [Chloroflexota bacterium]
MSEAGGGPAIALSEDEAPLVAEEALHLAGALSGTQRARTLALVQAARDGAVPAELVDVLEGVVLLALQTGRARRRYLAEGERLLTDVLRRTPRGRDLQEQLTAVNGALRTLAGRRLDGVRVEMRTLGHFTIALQCEGVSLTLAVRADGVQVESVSADGTPVVGTGAGAGGGAA